MAVMDVNIVGLNMLVGYITGAPALGHRAMTLALTEEGHLILRASQAIVPFRKGILKGSGGVETMPMGTGVTEVVIGYGGAASAYAWIIHTGISRYGTPFNFRNGKQAFYLKKPFDEALAGMPMRVAARVEEVMAVHA